MEIMPIDRTCVRHSQKDFDNLNGFVAGLWGVVVHSFNHVTASYWDSEWCVCPQQRDAGRRSLVRLFELFLVLLYCKVCRKGYNAFWALEPADARRPLAPWTLRLHNRVNGKLNKPLFPERLFAPFHIDTCEREAWERARVSHRWALWFWSMLYLAALNHPSSFDSADERHRDVRQAMTHLFQVMGEVIPSAARCFRDAYTHALLHSRMTSNATAPASLHFATRASAFHYVYELERAFNTHMSASLDRRCRASSSSIFGDSCTEVLEYFESVYRVETGAH